MSETNAIPTVAAQLAESLRGFGQLAGVPPLDEQLLATPKIHTGSPAQRIVCAVADLLQSGNYGLYRRAESFGTITEAGAWSQMDPDRLATWLPLECGIFAYREKEGERFIEGEISGKVARYMLASDQFRDKVPEIVAINPVRLPVWSRDLDERDDPARRGFRKIGLLSPGYDRDSKTFTVAPSAPFDETLDPKEGVRFLSSLLKTFPWGDQRSLAVQVAGMLSPFCRGLYPAGRAPLIVLNANMAGSGKTNLAKIMLHPTFRTADESGFSRDDPKQVKQELDAAAQESAPYVFFDDLPPGKIQDANLNRWVSGGNWQCRVLGTNRIFRGKVRAFTVMTGNRVILSPDLARRSLIIDLFANLAPKDRQLPGDMILIDEDFLMDEARQNEILSALFSLLRWWDDANRPRFSGQSLGGFDAWSRVVVPVVKASGFGDPLARPESLDFGDVEAVEFEKLVRLTIEEHILNLGLSWGTVSLKQFAGVARRNHLFVDQLGTVEDVLDSAGSKGGFNYRIEVPGDSDCQAQQWLDPGHRSRWGKYFRRSVGQGRYWLTEDGRQWKIGDRSNKDGSKFEVRLVVEGEDGAKPLPGTPELSSGFGPDDLQPF